MTLIDNNYTFSTAILSMMSTNATSLGLQDVWFGDQDRFPRTPCAVVEPGSKLRDYKGVPRMFNVALEAYVMLYVERIQDTQQSKKDVLQLGESTETLLHTDATLGGLVIDSYVSQSDPGYVTRAGTLLNAVRLTFTARSEKMLPHNP